MKANKGFLRYEDMATFQAQLDQPVHTSYRGYEVYKVGFWSQSPVMLQLLNILETFDLKKLGFGSAEYIHTLTESMKLAYADRDSYYGDPAFAKVPGAALLSKPYAVERAGLIGASASAEARPGSPQGAKPMHPAKFQDEVEFRPSPDTTCVNVVDKDGVMFSATPSGAWLPAVIAGETGIPLTQRLQSFLLIPGHPNELQPGKRPRITLSPTVVLRDGKPFLALSTPGGDNQDQALLQVLLDVIEFGMDTQKAVEAPRFETTQLVSSFNNHAYIPLQLYLDERFGDGTAKALAARGHRTRVRSRWLNGAAPTLIRVDADSGAIEAGADPFGYRYAGAW